MPRALQAAALPDPAAMPTAPQGPVSRLARLAPPSGSSAPRSRPPQRRSARHLDQAARPVGIARLKAAERCSRLQHVKQTAREPLVQGADQGLVFANGIPVWAVPQPDPHLLCAPPVDPRLKAEGGQGRQQRLLAARFPPPGKLAADLAPGGLDPPQASVARPRCARKPAGEVRICAGRAAAGMCPRRNPPDVARPPPLLPLPPALNQALLGKPLEVPAHPVGMEVELRGKLRCASRPAKLAEQREQARPRRLGERAFRTGCLGQVNHLVEVYTRRLLKPVRSRHALLARARKVGASVTRGKPAVGPCGGPPWTALRFCREGKQSGKAPDVTAQPGGQGRAVGPQPLRAGGAAWLAAAPGLDQHPERPSAHPSAGGGQARQRARLNRHLRRWPCGALPGQARRAANRPLAARRSARADRR